MKGKLILVVFAVLFLPLSCRKIFQETRIILHVVDDETGKPVPNATVLIYGVSIDYMNSMLHREVLMTDKAGKIDISISSNQEKQYIAYGWSIVVLPKEREYAHQYAHAKHETRNNKTIRLTKPATINLHYHPKQSYSALDSLIWGINPPKYVDPWRSFVEFEKFWLDRNMKSLPKFKFSNLDTTIKIICDPLTTSFYFYKTPMGVIRESCSLKSGEIKNVDIYY